MTAKKNKVTSKQTNKQTNKQTDKVTSSLLELLVAAKNCSFVYLESMDKIETFLRF